MIPNNLIMQKYMYNTYGLYICTTQILYRFLNELVCARGVVKLDSKAVEIETLALKILVDKQ